MKKAMLLVLVMTAPATAHGWWGVRNRCPREDFSAEVRRSRDEAQLDCHQMISLVEYQRAYANRIAAAAAPPMVGPAQTGSSPSLPEMGTEPGGDDILTLPDDAIDSSKGNDTDMPPKTPDGDRGASDTPSSEKP